MQIRVGFEMEYQRPGPTPMILALSIHYSRASDLARPDHLVTHPAVPVTAYRDLFGSWCSRLIRGLAWRPLVTGGLFYTVGVTFYLLANVWPWCHGIVQPRPRGTPRSEGMPCRVR
jgi:hypothetical protein